MKKTSWIYALLLTVICVTMVCSGFSGDSWQYWVGLACVVGAFLCGRFDERKNREIGGILDMKETGIIRRVDDLGRIVIPKEIRRQLGIAEGAPMELFMEDRKIVFQKYKSECVTERIEDLQRTLYEDEEMLGDEKVRKAEEHIKALKEIFKEDSNAD